MASTATHGYMCMAALCLRLIVSASLWKEGRSFETGASWISSTPTTAALRRSRSRRPVAIRTRLGMGDRSCAARFRVGDAVSVTRDVEKLGRNLNGRAGHVVETWEKCDVDPTCCCAEWVEEGLSVHVKFEADGEEQRLFGNETFVHYFAEAELEISAKLHD